MLLHAAVIRKSLEFLDRHSISFHSVGSFRGAATCFTHIIKTVPVPLPLQDVYSAFAPESEVSQCPIAGPPLSSPSQTPLSQSWSPCPPTHYTAIMGKDVLSINEEPVPFMTSQDVYDQFSLFKEFGCHLAAST